MDKEIIIKCLANEVLSSAILELSEQEKCTINYIKDDYQITVEAENYFFALLELRKKIEPTGIKILCKGCSKYVYPSPMIISMGNAMNAYELKLGKQATMKDLVSIFDPCDPDEYASIEDQYDYYQKWISSIIK